jgi:hypothetical protein
MPHLQSRCHLDISRKARDVPCVTLARLSACLPACLSGCLSVCLSVCIYVCLYICLSVWLAGWLAGCLSYRIAVVIIIWTVTYNHRRHIITHHHVLLISLYVKEVQSKFVQTQPKFIYCTELNVSPYFTSSSGSQFVFKHTKGGIFILIPQYV